MTYSLTDLVGNIGVAMIVFAYFRLQIGRWRSRDLPYLLFNLLARISHHPSTAAADMLAVTRRLLRCAVPAPLAVQGVRPARPLGGLRRSTGPSVPPRPSRRLDVVSATLAPSSGPRAPSQRHLDALATNGGEICGLGAILVVVSLVFDFNLSTMILQIFWIVISLVGLAHLYRDRHRMETGP
ncbi:CBU_0592 family membrane protein [Thioalkalivibrio thiocyanodenitrificans]|uniref:CBU_0592 family membrane protein n=1 Tax=Thioalkalivibrio thiocyanodenitrificans TaxID=243063 RepID=UPI00036E58CC|nr:hypothetical protein [Thioalkalivibrio thiocyanodenitrificans]